MLFSSGAVYEGQWKFDKMTGYATLNLPDGTIKEGTWRDGSLQGCAVFTWPDGANEYREYEAGRGSFCSFAAEILTTLSNPKLLRQLKQIIYKTTITLITAKHYFCCDNYFKSMSAIVIPLTLTLNYECLSMLYIFQANHF